MANFDQIAEVQRDCEYFKEIPTSLCLRPTEHLALFPEDARLVCDIHKQWCEERDILTVALGGPEWKLVIAAISGGDPKLPEPA